MLVLNSNSNSNSKFNTNRSLNRIDSKHPKRFHNYHKSQTSLSTNVNFLLLIENNSPRTRQNLYECIFTSLSSRRYSL